MSKKRYMSMALILFALAALSVAPAFAAAPVTITLWTGYSERLPVYNAAVADYTKEHPNVKIEISNFSLRESEQKLQVALSAGTAPDISGLSSVLTQRSAAQAYLDPVPAAFTGWMKDSYDPVYTNAVTSNGTMYGIPEVQGFQVLFYNLDDYAAAGHHQAPCHAG